LQKVEKPKVSGESAEAPKPAPASPFSEITEEDIEKLFG